MKQNLAEQKSLLAKLMAAEDITVVHENIKLPYFNLADRSLHCPILKEDQDIETTKALYDLYMSHEIGHALFTPLEGWHDAVWVCKDIKHKHDKSCVDKNFQGFLNVCDDARIERKIKFKFPGLKTSYNIAYRNLADRDFFGIKGWTQDQVDELPLIDKINIFYKIGNCQMVNFTPEEQNYVDDLGDIDTFAEVVDIARRIYKYDSDHQKGNLDDLKNRIAKAKAGNGDNNGKGKQQGHILGPGNNSGVKGESPMSYTDTYFRQMEQNLRSSEDVVTINLPSVNIKNAVKSTKVIYEEFLQTCMRTTQDMTLFMAKKAAEFFTKKNKDYIDFLVQQFMMKKNAIDYQRQRIFKTGELDGNLLNRYYFTNDVFRKMTAVVKGKSHGMVMFVDMSASMRGDSIYFALDQIITLVSFCKRLSIPYDVYGFADYATNPGQVFGRDCDFNFGQMVLRHLISSNDPGMQQRKSFEMLSLMALAASYESGMREPLKKLYGENIPYPKDPKIMPGFDGPFSMGGTPLCSTVVASRYIIEAFKDKTKVDIVNTVYLSDGQGGDSGTKKRNPVGSRGFDKYYIKDPKTKEFVITDIVNFQGALVELTQKITGTRHLGFYICHNSHVSRATDNFMRLNNGKDYNKFKRGKAKTELPEYTVGKYGFAAIPSLGFHTYYYLSSTAVENAANIQATIQKKDKLTGMDSRVMIKDSITLRDCKRAQKLMLSLFMDEVSNRL